jgi:hypothetical protein
MKRVSFLIFAGLLWLAGFDVMSYAATITWTNTHLGGTVLAVDSRGEPLWGTTEFGTQPDLSLGALVQLWKAVGEIDDPTGNPDAYRDLNWHDDDVLLDETHVGFGTWSYANGGWSRRGDYQLNEDSIFYVRAYNVSKPDFASTPVMERELTIRNREGEIVFESVKGIISNQTYFFDNLQTRPIPEPSAVLLVLAGIALAGMRRKKARLRVERKQEVL